MVYEDAETKVRTPVLGEKPKGRQIITAEGHWLTRSTNPVWIPGSPLRGAPE